MKTVISELDPHERRILASGLLVLGLSLASWSAASLWLALDHMGGLGAICGQATPHCGWCVSAAGGAVAAALTAWMGARLLFGWDAGALARQAR